VTATPHEPYRTRRLAIAGVALLTGVIALSWGVVTDIPQPRAMTAIPPWIGALVAFAAIVTEETVVATRVAAQHTRRRNFGWQLDGLSVTATVTCLVAPWSLFAIAASQIVVGLVAWHRLGRPAYKTAFNLGQKVAFAALAAMILSAGMGSRPIGLDTISLLSLLAAAIVYEFGSNLAVQLVVTVTTPADQRPHSFMVPLLTELQFAPGMVVYAAISGLLYRTIPWMLPLIIAPVVLAHLAVNKIIVSLDEAELTTAERDRLQASVGGVDDGVILVDGRLSPQLVSPSMALLLGAGDDALDRRTLDHLVPLVDESLEAVVRTLTPHGANAELFDRQLQRDDGLRLPVTVRVAGTFRDDDLDYAVVSVQDRSREQQVAQLKDAFLARVSHELRTPLTPVLSYAQLLRRHRDALATQEIDEALDQITSQTTHLATLVDDLLLVSRLAAGGLTSEDLVSAEAIDAADVVSTAVREANATWPNRQIHQEVSSSPVMADPTRLRQVLTNLLSNACKYSDDATPVTITCATTDGDVRIAVQDHGVGIPEVDLPHVSEQFYRVRGHRAGGAGVGLHLVQELVTAMGGHVEVQSRVGVGSTFTVVLPAQGPTDVTNAPTWEASSP
jgi:signal transduction histidine kinase